MEINDLNITIEDIVENLFPTYSVRLKKKDIYSYFISKLPPKSDLFENGDSVTVSFSEDDIKKEVDIILKKDQASGNDSFLRYSNGQYSKRPKRNPGINPAEGIYKGKAGECAVMSELLFRGYNVNNMMVDEGVDLVASKNNVFYYIQVKTTVVTEKNRIYCSIKQDRFDSYVGTQIRYIIVARCNMRGQDTNIYFVFDNKDIDKFMYQQLISHSEDRINIKIEFDDRTGKAIIYDKARQDVSYHMNRFEL